MKRIFLVKVKETNSAIQYVAYLENTNGMSLIAPCNNPKEAKEIGMTFNGASSSLPPYTFKVWRYTNRLVDVMTPALHKMGIKGKFKMIVLSGYLENFSTHKV